MAKKKEISIEEKYDLLQEMLVTHDKEERKKETFYSYFLKIWLLLSLVSFILIFFIKPRLPMVLISLTIFIVGFVIFVAMSNSIKKFSEALILEEIEKFDGLFIWDPIFYTKNSNNHYMVFKISTKGATLFAYRLDVNQFKEMKKMQRYKEYVFFNKELLIHPLNNPLECMMFDAEEIYYWETEEERNERINSMVDEAKELLPKEKKSKKKKGKVEKIKEEIKEELQEIKEEIVEEVQELKEEIQEEAEELKEKFNDENNDNLDTNNSKEQ